MSEPQSSTANQTNVKIALYNKGEIVGYTLVDADVAPPLELLKWRLSPYGYAYRNLPRYLTRHGLDSRVEFMHRRIMGLEYGDKREVDHINGDRLDNRRENLRIVSHAEQQHNQPTINNRGTSKYRGVSWREDKQKWRACVMLDQKQHFVGHFEHEGDAAAAAAAFRAQHMRCAPEANASSE